MKRKRFSVEQISAVLKQAELGIPAAELIRRVGLSEQTFCRWKRKYSGWEVDPVRELKQAREENASLKRIVADLTLTSFCKSVTSSGRGIKVPEVFKLDGVPETVLKWK